jgi:SpoVK/Ycf46/Vps4 family AAA+-type ATPase
MEILKIHAANITKHGDIDYEAVVKLAENFNGADLRNVCTEAGMFAIRDERDYIVQVTSFHLIFCSPQPATHEASGHAYVQQAGRMRWCAVVVQMRSADSECILAVQEDMMKAVRKLNEAKKLEGNLSYDQSFGEGK